MSTINDDRPPQPNAARLRCAICERVFAAGYVPAPESSGPWAGSLVCRDCRPLQPYLMNPLLPAA